MSDWIEFDPVDHITTGALGPLGRRVFLIQAGRGHTTLSVLVEKEQVALLAARLLELLGELDEALPDDDDEPVAESEVPPVAEEPEPLFRARMMRIGFDTVREMVVLELFEDAPPELEDVDELDDELIEAGPGSPIFEDLGHVVRIYATRAQMRAVALRGAEAVASGRQPCPLCLLPMDPAGHDCPSRN